MLLGYEHQLNQLFKYGIQAKHKNILITDIHLLNGIFRLFELNVPSGEINKILSHVSKKELSVFKQRERVKNER